MDRKSLTPTRGDLENIQDPYTEITRTEAILNGFVLYWNGQRCENGHRSVRYTKTGICKECYRMFRNEEIDQRDMSKDKLSQQGIPKNNTVSKKVRRKQSFGNDPIHLDAGEWYFWDETWSNKLGPYQTERGARAALDRHTEELNNG